MALQMSISRGINKHSVVYAHDGILLLHKKEWTIDTHKWHWWTSKCYVNCKKTDQKRLHIIWPLSYSALANAKSSILREGRPEAVCRWGCGEREEGELQRENFHRWWICLVFWLWWWFYRHMLYQRPSLIAQVVKNPPAMQETRVRFLGQKDPLEKGSATHTTCWASLVAQLVKNLPAMWETWVQSLSWEDSYTSNRCNLLHVNYSSVKLFFKKWTSGEFPGSLVAKSPCFHCKGTGSNPGHGTKILQTARPGKRKQNPNK